MKPIFSWNLNLEFEVSHETWIAHEIHNNKGIIFILSFPWSHFFHESWTLNLEFPMKPWIGHEINPEAMKYGNKHQQGGGGRGECLRLALTKNHVEGDNNVWVLYFLKIMRKERRMFEACTCWKSWLEGKKLYLWIL